MEVGGREARRNAFQKIQLSGRHTQSGHGVPVALAQQEERAEIVGELRLIVAGGALQGAVLGDDVPAAAGLQLAHGEHRCICGIQLTADYCLEVLDYGAGHNNSVDALLGRRTMTASAMDIDGKHVGGGHAGAGFHGNLTCLHVGPDMDTEAGINAVHGTLLDHAGRTLGHLFRRLEGQLHGAAELVLVVVEQPGHCEHGSGMAVMAAGVHHAGILAGIINAGLLLYGEGIHVPPQKDGLAGLCALDGGQHAGLQAAGAPLDAVLVQLGLDGLAGLIFLAADFRMGMEMAAHLYQIIVIGSCNLFDIHYLVS